MDRMGTYTRARYCDACQVARPEIGPGLRPQPPVCPDCGGPVGMRTGRWLLRTVRGWFFTRTERVRFVPGLPPRPAPPPPPPLRNTRGLPEVGEAPPMPPCKPPRQPCPHCGR